jgi:hypothetical protein
MVAFGAPFTTMAQTVCCTPPPVTSQAACDDSGSCLSLGPKSWVTFGGEYRARYESLDRQDFGIANSVATASIANRGLLSADARHASGWRAFVQLSAADQDGRKPAARPFDESDLDLAQAFVEIPVQLGTAHLTARLGRQELALGNRLVGLRDGVILRRAFDGGRFDLDYGGNKLIAFHASPVQNARGAFDDKPIAGETFNGLIWQAKPLSSGERLSAFVFDRERRVGRYQQVSGRERRQTYGAQFSKRTPTHDVTAQGGVQVGQVAQTDVLAFGGAIDMGWTKTGPSPVRYGLQFGYASGDSDPADKDLTTFDPLYPNLGAFTDAPLYFYANQINAQANVTKTMGRLIVRSELTLLARATTKDAIYSSSGRPLAGRASGGLLSATTLDVSARFRINPNLELYASALHAEALDGVTDLGGRDTNYFLLQLTTGF